MLIDLPTCYKKFLTEAQIHIEIKELNDTISATWPVTEPLLNFSSTIPIPASISLKWSALNIQEELQLSGVKEILGVQAGHMKTSQKQTHVGRYQYSSRPWYNPKKLLETLFFATLDLLSIIPMSLKWTYQYVV